MGIGPALGLTRLQRSNPPTPVLTQPSNVCAFRHFITSLCDCSPRSSKFHLKKNHVKESAKENGERPGLVDWAIGIVINGQKESEQENYHGHRLGLEDWAWSSMVKERRKGNFPERSTTTTGLLVVLLVVAYYTIESSVND